MKTKFLTRLVMAAAMVLTATITVRAGTITIVNLPPRGTDLATGIDPNKQYVSCFDYGSLNTTTYSVNGVPFAHFRSAAQNIYLVTNWVDPNHGGQVIVSVAATNHGIDATSSATQGSPGNQADGNMLSLLTDLMYPGNGAPLGGWILQEYDNLTIGHPYSLRLYYRYWGNIPGDRLQNVFFNGEGTWQGYAGNPFDEDAGTNGVLSNGLVCHGARYIQYNFTASATNVFCMMSNFVVNGAAMIEAATLEDTSVPYAPFITYEPSATGATTNSFVWDVAAIGTGSLSYQWYFNTESNYVGAVMATNDGVNYEGVTTSDLTVMSGYTNYYFVVITNNYGSVTSSIAQINPTPVILTQPSPTIVGTNVVLSVLAAGQPPLTFSWYYNTTASYSGATLITDGNGYSGSATASLTVSTNLLDYYFVVITNSSGSVSSSIVVLAAPLTVLSAGEPIWNQAGQSNIIVTFSGGVNSTATSTGNYSLSGGFTISNITLAASNEVVLRTAVLNPTNIYTLHIQNVQDSYGVPMAPASTNMTVGAYPSDLALWVRANAGVTLDPGTNSVNEWTDMSGNTNNLLTAIGYGFAEPLLETNAWGDVVVHFDSTNGYEGTALLANDAPSLEIVGDISIIAVVNVTIPPVGSFSVTNGEIVSKDGYSGNIAAPYDYNIASSGATLYRGNGNNSGSGYGWVSATVGPSAGTPHIVAVSESGETISHYVDGQLVSQGLLVNNRILGSTFTETNSADEGQPVFVGGRGDYYVQHLEGDLAELIVAGSAMSSYDVASMDKYLVSKHNLVFIDTNPGNVTVSASANQVTLSWPATYVGWQVQSNSVGLADTNAWFAVPGSTTTNQLIITPGTNESSVFYRMVYPPQ